MLAALRERLGERVTFARGCDVNSDARHGFDEAVAVARQAEVAILVMGDKAGLTDDCTSGESRDRASLDLPGVQQELVLAVAATGTPVVLVLVAGRPYGGASLHERCAAVAARLAPRPGGRRRRSRTGCSGSFNPGGKLPISYPRSSGQLPVFYGHKASGGRSHWKVRLRRRAGGAALSFGHGLSYTSFELEAASVRRAEATLGETVTVDVTVRNSGAREGDEVVQLYVRDPVASVTRPVLELKGFVRARARGGCVAARDVRRPGRPARVPRARPRVRRRAGRDRALRRHVGGERRPRPDR